MQTAIFSGILAAFGAGAIICIILIIMRRARGSKVKKSNKRKVASVDSFGVESDVRSATGGEAHMGDGGISAGTGGGLDRRYMAAGIFAGAAFSALAIKAFMLQVVNGDKYREQSENNLFATVYSPAPRGGIYDERGVQLVKNRSCLTVLADAKVADDRDIVGRLSAVLGLPRNIVRQRIQDATSGAQAHRVVATDVNVRDVAFISEHSDAFSGVSVETRTVREYPYGGLAAHVLGYTGVVSQEEIDAVKEGRDLQLGDDVGKSGVEGWYDNLLAGEHGKRRVITNADGNVISVVSETGATKGSDIRLTINAMLQYRADRELMALVAPTDNTIGTGSGTAAALVVMDVRDGSIKAMSSYPTYNPGEFVGGISTGTWEIYNSNAAHNPLMNRCISGTYPAASTFKAFTGLAGLRYEYAGKEKHWDCTGEWDGFNSGDIQKCWNIYGHHDIDFRKGIVESCDVVFYEIAKEFFDNRGDIGNTAMQDEIKKFGFGNLTGIDLAGEAYGRVPTPEWKAEYFKDVPEESSWKGGDLTNMAIGQGYVLVTPLQLAVAYGGVATGKLMKPHLLKEVVGSDGEVVVKYEPECIGEPDIDPNHYAIMRDALHGVFAENVDVKRIFRGFPGVDAGAKTGTAEVQGKGDFGWAACYAPFDDPHYVVTCICEEGGGGAKSAMPSAVALLNAVLQCEAGTYDFGVGLVQGSTGKVKERTYTSEGRQD